MVRTGLIVAALRCYVPLKTRASQLARVIQYRDALTVGAMASIVLYNSNAEWPGEREMGVRVPHSGRGTGGDAMHRRPSRRALRNACAGFNPAALRMWEAFGRVCVDPS